MRVICVNPHSDFNGRIFQADQIAWDRGDFWIPLVHQNENGSEWRGMLARRNLREV